MIFFLVAASHQHSYGILNPTIKKTPTVNRSIEKHYFLEKCASTCWSKKVFTSILRFKTGVLSQLVQTCFSKVIISSNLTPTLLLYQDVLLCQLLMLKTDFLSILRDAIKFPTGQQTSQCRCADCCSCQGIGVQLSTVYLTYVYHLCILSSRQLSSDQEVKAH